MRWEDEIVGLDVSTAGLHISECIARDASLHLDLEEAIESSRYSSNPYSSYPREWPALAEVVGTRKLPPDLIAKHHASGGEGSALCGFFPDIRRAWASIDNSIFLWPFDRDGLCLKHDADDQAICAVGIAKTKPGVFVEAIQYLLVLATPLELILVGLCCASGGDGADPFAEISLQRLTEYSIPSDGITMTCIACTNKGRIFLAGQDGHIYEMLYISGSGWHKCCRKICLTSGLGTLVSRWILPNAFNFVAADPIIDMVVDNERHILYARTEGAKLKLFDLGPNGDAFKRVAEEKNLTDPHDPQHGNRRSAASRSTTRAMKPCIVCIAPLSSVESKCLHLVVVLSDGRRLYLSSTGVGGTIHSFPGSESAIKRPCLLKVVASRPSPSRITSGLTFGDTDISRRIHSEDLNLKAEAASYSSGTLVLSDSSSSVMSSLLLINKHSNIQASLDGNLGVNSRGSRALCELVSSLNIEGRMLFVAEVLPQADVAGAIHSLYLDSEALDPREVKAVGKLWAKGDIPMQHILPRKRIVVFSTMGMVDVIFNRPVDILIRLLESNASRSLVEDFFNRFGTGEASAMCLMLAARIAHLEENIVSNIVAEKAAEAFEDSRLVGMPQLNGSSALSATRTPPGGFSMGQVVQEAEPIFSGAYDGLCLCVSRLLYPIWEFPIMVTRGSPKGVIVCRISLLAIQVLEMKIRSLEMFLRSRRDQRRGLYGYVASLRDSGGSILYGTALGLSSGKEGATRNLFGVHPIDNGLDERLTSSKRQHIRYSPAELAATEVRAMECLRRMLRRSGEALFLLGLLSQHNMVQLLQRLDSQLQQKVLQLTFCQLVCSDEDVASRLISELMEYCIGSDGLGTVDEISAKLRVGCPSYFNKSDYKYFLALEWLEKASLGTSSEERDNLAKKAFDYLANIPDFVDLRTVCKRFEDLRFYEAVVRLPLQKAQTLVDGVSSDREGNSTALQEQCYSIIADALHSLKGEQVGSQVVTGSGHLDPASRDRYICQIVQLSIQWPDKLFHEYLYKVLIELGLEKELLEYGGPDLVPFLQNAARETSHELHATSPSSSVPYPVESQMSSTRCKYLDLLAQYYVMSRQHLLAADVLNLLAERQITDGGPPLEQRYQYLSNAVLQAKSATGKNISASVNHSTADDGLAYMLESKLSVLRFQIKIKEELESLASRLESASGASGSLPNGSFPGHNVASNASTAESARIKSNELSLNLKSISQLCNEYALPFQLWEICIGILNFANYSGGADTKTIKEAWSRLIDQALSRGGVGEACSVVKRVSSTLCAGDEASIPLDLLCFHLEKAAQVQINAGVEIVGDEDVPRTLLAACKGAAEDLLREYDRLLSNGSFFPSPELKLRFLRSILTVLREWSLSMETQTARVDNIGVSHVSGRSFVADRTPTLVRGVRDKITGAANRYMMEVRRLALPQSQTEAVYRGFQELEGRIVRPFPL